VAFNPEKTLLASGGKDRTVRLWDSATGKMLSMIKMVGPVQSLAFSANGRLLAIGFWGGKNHGIEVRDARTFDVLLSADHDLKDIHRLALFDRGNKQYLAGCGDSGFSIWTLESSVSKPGGLALKPMMHEKANRCLSLAVSPGPDPRWIAWVREERKVALWDLQNSRAGELNAPPMNQGWHGLAFFPDGERLAFVSHTAAAEIWDVASDKHLFQLGDENQFHAPHIALSKDGKRFAGLLKPDVVSIWNMSDRKLLYSFRPEQSEVWSLDWSSDGDRLAVGLSDGGLVVWDLPTVEAELARLGLESSQR
jgi:WD40 repeat protein